MVRGLNSAAEGELEWLGEFAKGEKSFLSERVHQTECILKIFGSDSCLYFPSNSENLGV